MGAIAYRRLRAPQGQGEALLDPPFSEALAGLDANRRAASAWTFSCAGQSLAHLRRELRREVLAAATSHVREYAPARGAANIDPEAPLLVTGHQPQLFHPGVWFKNFLLDSLAARAGGVALNLIIDNDLAREAGVHVPSGTPNQAHLESVPYDRPLAEGPWEERPILDRELFASFATRVRRAVSGFVAEPLVDELWPACERAAARHNNLGRALAEGRHALEMQWGLSTWELPLSRVCETAAFRRFVVHVLANLPRFMAAYNGALEEYREVHDIRSGAHPAPNLHEREGLLEAPFWIWSRSAPQRRPVWIQWSAEQVTLTGETPLTLPLGTPERFERAAELLADASAAGLRLRPRALMTTLFARLFLADLFVHGIGGAKYDQVTDIIMGKFFGIEPPQFVTATATIRLPGQETTRGEAELRLIESELRNLTYHPEMFLGDSLAAPTEAQKAWEQKRFWLGQALPRGARSPRQRGIAEANRALAAFVAEPRRRLLTERERLAEQLPSQRIVNSREHSFCLFPSPFLRGLLLAISHSTR